MTGSALHSISSANSLITAQFVLGTFPFYFRIWSKNINTHKCTYVYIHILNLKPIWLHAKTWHWHRWALDQALSSIFGNISQSDFSFHIWELCSQQITLDFSLASLTARIALSLSTKSASLSKRWPLSDASILLHTEPREKARRAALTALSASTCQGGMKNRALRWTPRKN